MSSHLEWAREQYPDAGQLGKESLEQIVSKNIDYVRGLLSVGGLFGGAGLVFVTYCAIEFVVSALGIDVSNSMIGAASAFPLMVLYDRFFSLEDKLVRWSIQREMSEKQIS